MFVGVFTQALACAMVGGNIVDPGKFKNTVVTKLLLASNIPTAAGLSNGAWAVIQSLYTVSLISY